MKLVRVALGRQVMAVSLSWVAGWGCNAFDDPAGPILRGPRETPGSPSSDAGTVVPTPREPVCGNGRLESGEDCDLLAGMTGIDCRTVGFGTGAVACDPDSCRIDTSGCVGIARGCPSSPLDLDGVLCDPPDLVCSYPPSCGGAECRCLEVPAPDPPSEIDAGSDDDAGTPADPIHTWRCSIRPC